MKKILIVFFQLSFMFAISQKKYDVFLSEYLSESSTTSVEELDSFYSNIMSLLMYAKKDTLKFGFINTKGEVVIEQEFDFATDFYGEIANVIKNGVSGILYKNGETKFFENYSSTFWHKGEFGIAFKNNKAGFIDKKGNVVIPIEYDEVYPFFDGFASVKKDNRWFYINELGFQVLSDSLTYNYRPIVDSKAIFMTKDSVESKKNRLKYLIMDLIEYLDKEEKFDLKEGLIDVNGNVLLEPIYDEITGCFINGYMRVRNNKMVGIINNKSEIIIPIDYQEVNDISEGLFCAKKSNKWGFINSENKIIIPFIYDKLSSFKEGKAFFSLDGINGYLNKSNELIIKTTGQISKFIDFSEGLAITTVNNKCGYIDESGRLVIDNKYDKALPFRNGIAIVSLDGMQFLIDKKGNKITNSEHLNLWTESEGLLRFAN